MPNWRSEFPFKDVIYLDSAASAQKPACVLKAMDDFYKYAYANTHRGVHALTQKATLAYETCREKIGKFLNAPASACVVITRGTTHGINMVARGWGDGNVSKGDIILVSTYEHHSNFLPWVELAKRAGAKVELLPLLADGSLDLEAYRKILLTQRVKLVCVAHASNVLGVISDLPTIISCAHERAVKVFVDGAQSVAHLPVDLSRLKADFFVFSGHKLYGPTGIGGLIIAPGLSDIMQPAEFGGGMVHVAEANNPRYAPTPYRFEAGTPPIAEAVGLSAAIDFVSKIGFEAIMAHEAKLTQLLLAELSALPFVKIQEGSRERIGVVSFLIDGVHPHDAGTILDAEGVAVRVGHHCAQPLMRHLGVDATIRASLGLYNSVEDVRALVAAVDLAHQKLA